MKRKILKERRYKSPLYDFFLYENNVFKRLLKFNKYVNKILLILFYRIKGKDFQKAFYDERDSFDYLLLKLD